ncbi:unnamed protein product [Periconia digitata]|uniref:Uncharacterized protein n=1 Tax=Periconia digitata TaxID=1303443 RepID=A0A9W4TZW8_9PLEO|nr:unnamed protein product [Periconia digitata]
MAVDHLESRLQFLSQAANLLAVSAPAVSANLGAAHQVLLAANDKDIEMQSKEWGLLRRNVCGGCGNVMIPGLSCSVSRHVEVGKKKRSKSAPPTKEEPKKQVIYTCSRCERKTAQSVPSRPPKHMGVQPKATQSQASQQPASASTSMEQESKIVKSSNATSKQRKKARKGGLQAMLNKSKASTSTSGGLDLMDFMQ